MMGKLKTILTNIAGRINSQALAEIAANNSFDLEVEEDIINEINSGFEGLMTMEAAKNNPEIVEHVKANIHKPLKKSILGTIDEAILDYSGKIFEKDQVDELKGIESTNEKLKKFMTLSQDFITRHSKDGDSQKVVAQLKTQVEDLNKQIEKTRASSDKEMQKLKSGYEDQLIDHQLRSSISKFELGSEYTKEPFIRDAVLDKVISQVRQRSKLAYDPENRKVVPLNPENPDLPLFIDNKKVEDLDLLIKPLIDPFVKKQPGKQVQEGGTYKPVEGSREISTMAADFAAKRKE